VIKGNLVRRRKKKFKKGAEKKEQHELKNPNSGEEWATTNALGTSINLE